MPVSCCAVNCTNHFKKGSGIKFYIIPANDDKRRTWVRAIFRANWEPSKYDRLCGEHFVSGGPSDDPSDIDYVPSVFKDGKRRSQCRPINRDREERRSKRAKHLEIVEEQAGAITRSNPDVDKLMDDSFGQTLDAEGLAKDVRRLTKAIEGIVKRNQELEQRNKDLEGINQQLVHANTELSIEVMSLREELANSRKGSSKCSLLSVVEDNDKKVKFYTGLPTYLVFLALFEYLLPKIKLARESNLHTTAPEHQGKGRKHKLEPLEEYLAVLVRLRLGLLLEDVADRFGVL